MADENSAASAGQQEVELSSASELETEELGQRLGEALLPDGILLLEGDLGSGKTVLVRGVARAAGADPAEVQSPTFTLIHHYQGERSSVTHIDLYRLEPEEVVQIGLDELLAGPGIKAIEWPERMPDQVDGAVTLRLYRRGPGRRAIVVTGLEPRQLVDATTSRFEESL